MKTYGGVVVQGHVFLTSVLVRGDTSETHSCLFASDTHWMQCWVVLVAGLHDLEKGKFVNFPGLKLRSTPSSSPKNVALATELPRLPLIFYSNKSHVFWDVFQCSPLDINLYFGEGCRFHLQSQRICQGWNKQNFPYASGWAVYRRFDVFPVRYELGSYIPQ
jgi:hypothetical protein